ncbi:MAG: class I mannose-6-phosphate isomerase, partial [Lachnospiraceae bacterium]|nr:class I mannose-6-phosphate isomerase [Lachnospiraceae bacterium]
LSIVAGGEYAGMTLREVLSLHPEYLGTHPLVLTGGKPELPILVKLIDARKDLSIQVHPDDTYALEHENSLGKTEMWYVLHAAKNAELIYGFRQNVTKDQVLEGIRTGLLSHQLNHVPVEKDDVFFIEPGTVHAIGAGVLVAEVQESSNVTYRLYDYDRIDKSGNRRPLHIEKALETANLNASREPRQPMRVLRYRGGFALELLSRCKYFQVERMLLNTEIHRQLPSYRTQENSFHVLLCTDGCGTVSGESFTLNFFKGDCIFVPAGSIALNLHGKGQLLDISC